MKNTILDLCKKIGINSEWTYEIELCISRLNISKVNSMANMLLDDSTKNEAISILKQEKNNEFEIENQLYNLIVFLTAGLSTHKKYKKLNISDQIFYDTIRDVKIWAENCFKDTGNIGLLKIDWLLKHINMQIFKLGRLQFEMTKNEFSFRDNIFMLGDEVLSVHIPEGDKLSHEACQSSYEFADEFFKRYFLDFDYKGYYCYSWLLDKRLENILDDNSNILKFQSNYKVVHTDDNLDEIKKRIFGYVSDDLSQYPQDTRIRRGFIKYVQNGGMLGNSYGYLNIKGEGL